MKINELSKKIAVSTLAVGMIVGSSIVPACAATGNLSTNNYTAESSIIVPFDMDVSSGSYSGTEFQASYSLKKSNGKNVNFWIKNTGDVDVKITINGSGAKTYAPGESGHISASVGTFSKTYKFKAVPTPNGGEISIDYSIAQRD